jgi:hypothetical protein
LFCASVTNLSLIWVLVNFFTFCSS